MNAIVLALALSAAPASALASGSRRLRDSVDLPKLYEASGKGQLGTKIHYKLDAAAAAASGADAVAGEVASKLDCDKTPSRIFRAAGKHEAAHKAAGLDLWYEVKCAHEAGDKFTISRDVMAKLEAYLDSDDHSGVQLIEPELEHATSWSPNDPELNQQPHYDTVKMQGAWDVTKGLKDVVVQVLDTGIDMAHPDLQMNIWRNEGEICNNGIDDDNNGFVDDCHGYNHADDTGTDLLGNHWHGTHCGGTVAADSNNGVGVAGVAGGDGTPDSGVKLMISVGFGDTSVGGFAEALVYGADNGAHVSSNSWGYTAPGAYEQTVLDAIDYYNARVTAGVADGTVVFAAGNQASSSDYYPGFYDGTVAVAAVDTSMIAAGFTNYGDWIDISAPGVSVYSTMTGDGYGYASGTSMACPHVAGILALGKSVDFFASREKLLNCMTSTAHNIDPINGAKAGLLGAGLVDAYQFLLCLKDPIGDPKPTARPTFNDNGPKPTPKPTPGQQTPKPTPGSDEKPCCVGRDGLCEFHWWNGDIQTESECLGFHPLCKWICPDDDEPPKPTPKPTKPIEQTPKPTPGDDKPCCVDPTGQCQHLWWNGFLQTEDKCEAFNDGLCKWICDDDEPPPKPTPKPTPGDEKPCCIGGQGECQQMWWNGYLQTEDKCEAYHGGDMCKWICNDDEPVTPQPTWSWGDDDDDDDNTWEPKPPLKVKFVDIIRGHKKVGPVGVMTWLAECDPTTVDCDDVDPYIGNYFKIEYRTEKNGPWTVVEDPGPDGARPFFREVDGTFRHVLVEAPCMEKVQVRITGAGFVYGGADDPPLVVYSDAVVSKPKKLKC